MTDQGPIKIVLVRVDARLVHGQVVEDWVPATGADLLIVANDEAAADPMQSLILENCTFCGELLVKVIPIAEVGPLLRSPPKGRHRALVLLREIADVPRLLREGVTFDSLNLGNVHAHPGAQSVTPAVHLDDGEIDALRVIEAKGVDVDIRAVTRQPRISLSAALATVGR